MSISSSPIQRRADSRPKAPSGAPNLFFGANKEGTFKRPHLIAYKINAFLCGRAKVYAYHADLRLLIDIGIHDSIVVQHIANSP